LTWRLKLTAYSEAYFAGFRSALIFTQNQLRAGGLSSTSKKRNQSNWLRFLLIRCV